MDSLLAQEMAKKYNHTVSQIVMKKTGEVKTVFFDGFALEVDNPYCIVYFNDRKQSRREFLHGLISTTSEKLLLNSFTILPMPDRQVYDYGGRTLVYSRLPNRQWRKGLVMDNTLLEDPMYSMLSDIPNNNSFKLHLERVDRYGLKLLHNLFLQDYAGSIEKAIQDIAEHDLLSRAISDKYWLGCFLEEDKPYILYRHSTPVAFYNNKIDTLTPVSKIYLQEITDFCNRFNLTAKIEV